MLGKRVRLLALIVVTLAAGAVPAQAAVPVITIDVPRPGDVFEVGEAVKAQFSCTDTDPADPSQCEGTVMPGSVTVHPGDPLPTGAPGTSYSLTVTASNADGSATPSPRTYDVVDERCADISGVEVSRNGSATVNPNCQGEWESVAVTQQPPADQGTASPASDGRSIVYQPSGFTGMTQFDYAVTNADGDQLTAATVTVDVSPCDDFAGSVYAGFNTPLQLTCAEPYGAIVVKTPPPGTDATVNPLDPAAGTVQFLSQPGFLGKTTFTFAAQTGSGDSVPATATITVMPIPSGGGSGGGDDSFGSSGGSGLVLDEPEPASQGLPAIPFLPSLGNRRHSGNLPTSFARKPGVTVSRRAVRVSPTGRVSLRIRNANRFQVEGRLVIEGAFRPGKKHHRRVARLHSERRVTLRARRSATVVLSLSPGERRLLSTLGQTKMRATLRVRDVDRHTRTLRTSFTLRAAR